MTRRSRDFGVESRPRRRARPRSGSAPVGHARVRRPADRRPDRPDGCAGPCIASRWLRGCRAYGPDARSMTVRTYNAICRPRGAWRLRGYGVRAEQCVVLQRDEPSPQRGLSRRVHFRASNQVSTSNDYQLRLTFHVLFSSHDVPTRHTIIYKTGEINKLISRTLTVINQSSWS